MTLDLHKGNGVDTERRWNPTTTTLRVLHDEPQTTFGRSEEHTDRKSTRLNSSHSAESRMPSSA